MNILPNTLIIALLAKRQSVEVQVLPEQKIWLTLNRLWLSEA